MNASRLVLALVALGCSRAAAPPPPQSSPTPAATVGATNTMPAAPTTAAPTPAAVAALVVESPARDAVPAAGEPAPSFHGTTHDGHAVASTGAARPRVLVVYFYPRDETPGCTREACAFRDSFRAYDEAGADIVGVSTDDEAAHRGFAQHHTLPFGLLADPQGTLANAFGLHVAPGGYAPRTTFVIGRDGKIAQVFPDVRVDGHADAVLAAVRQAASH